MDKLIVIIFDTEAKAYEGLKKLQELDGQGGFDVHASAVVAKDADGKVAVRQAVGDGPWGAAAGLALGSLVGVLAGPAGVALGAAAGALSGAWGDYSKGEVDELFLTGASKALEPGKSAIIASVHETWATPLDASVSALGGTVLRRARSEVSEDIYARQVKSLKAEISQYEAELKKTGAEWQGKITAKIDELNKQLQDMVEAIEKRRMAVQREGEAKLQTLQKQAESAGAELRAAYNSAIKQLREEYNKRVEQLKV